MKNLTPLGAPAAPSIAPRETVDRPIGALFVKKRLIVSPESNIFQPILVLHDITANLSQLDA